MLSVQTSNWLALPEHCPNSSLRLAMSLQFSSWIKHKLLFDLQKPFWVAKLWEAVMYDVFCSHNLHAPGPILHNKLSTRLLCNDIHWKLSLLVPDNVASQIIPIGKHSVEQQPQGPRRPKWWLTGASLTSECSSGVVCKLPKSFWVKTKKTNQKMRQASSGTFCPEVQVLKPTP